MNTIFLIIFMIVIYSITIKYIRMFMPHFKLREQKMNIFKTNLLKHKLRKIYLMWQ